MVMDETSVEKNKQKLVPHFIKIILWSELTFTSFSDIINIKMDKKKFKIHKKDHYKNLKMAKGKQTQIIKC